MVAEVPPASAVLDGRPAGVGASTPERPEPGVRPRRAPLGAPAVTAGHLMKRFFGSMWPAGPSAEAERWVSSVLSEGEQKLWGRMSRADRRHAVGVGRRVELALGAEADRKSTRLNSSH